MSFKKPQSYDYIELPGLFSFFHNDHKYTVVDCSARYCLPFAQKKLQGKRGAYCYAAMICTITGGDMQFRLAEWDCKQSPRNLPASELPNVCDWAHPSRIIDIYNP